MTEGLLMKHRVASPELSRKIVHMVHGLVIATGPFFVTYKTIILVECFLLATAIVAKRLGWFKGLSAVNRLSWGELAFPLGVIVSALMAPPAWVFAVAMLHVGLADAVAALVGKNYGKHPFKVFGQKKSLEGSSAFFIVSGLTMILLLTAAPMDIAIHMSLVLVVPFASTLAEAATPFGLDNFVIPVVVVALLSL